MSNLTPTIAEFIRANNELSSLNMALTSRCEALEKAVAYAPHDFLCGKSKMPEAKPGQIFMTSDDIRAHQDATACTCWKKRIAETKLSSDLHNADCVSQTLRDNRQQATPAEKQP